MAARIAAMAVKIPVKSHTPRVMSAIAVTIDIRNYAKYLLREGADIEKRELLGCLRSKITLEDKEIALIS